MDLDLLAGVFYLIASTIIGGFILLILQGIGITPKFFKNGGCYVVCIVVSLAILYFFYVTDFPFSNEMSVLIPTVIVAGFFAGGLDTLYMRTHFIVCPSCGSWGESELLKVLEEGSYEEDVTVQRDVYNNRNQKVGYIEDTVTETRPCEYQKLKCKRCGHIFETWVKY